MNVDLDSLPFGVLAKLVILSHTAGAAWQGRTEAVLGAIRRQRERAEAARAAARPAPARVHAPRTKPTRPKTGPSGTAAKHALAALEKHRADVAFHAHSYAPERVVHRAGLYSMLWVMPENKEQLERDCHGWGPTNTATYGAGFLAVLNSHRAAMRPQ